MFSYWFGMLVDCFVQPSLPKPGGSPFYAVSVLYFLLFLLVRPFVDHFETDPDAVRVVSMIDLSGSMNTKDPHEQNSRIDQVRPFFQLDRSDSWIIQSRARYGSVDRLGFSGEEIFPVRSTSWDRPNEGAPTSIGDALLNILEHKDMDQPSALVLFSDGKNNLGSPHYWLEKNFGKWGCLFMW